MKKYIIFLCLIISCSIFVLVGCKKIGQNSIYEFVPVEKRTITQFVEASGTINPVKTVNIGSQVSGRIEEIYVDFNSEVKKGQLLAQIDPSLFEAQVDKATGDLNAAMANYSKSKSTLDFDKKNYERYKKLYTKNYVSKSELDLAESTYFASLAQVNAMSASISQAKATLENNLTNLRYTKIISPVDGIVVSRAVDVGQTVAASFQTPELFIVAQDLTKMQIEVSVSEADIGKIKAGQEVDYTLDGYPDEVFKGIVSQVRISPTTVSNVVTYTVIVTVDNSDGKLIPGMTANVSIITSKKEGALAVPIKALKFSPKEITGGKKFKEQGIWIIENKTPKRISIKTGLSDGEYTEIISDQIKLDIQVITGRTNEEATKNFKPRMRMF